MDERGTTRSPGSAARPVAVGERALAPDLARGVALLGIAVANGVVHLYGRELGPSSRPLESSPADRAVDVVAALLVDNRGYPLFAFLLGYGTAQLVARQQARGVPAPDTSGVLLRRGVALLALGAVHAALLFSGDILGLYGLLALLLALLREASSRALLVGVAVCLVPFTVLGALDGLARGDVSGLSRAEPQYLVAVALRLLEWTASLAVTPVLGVGLLAPMLLGVVAARRRVLDEPSRHRPLLRLVAGTGVPLGVAGGVPLALTSTGAWSAPTAVDVLVGAVHALSGLAGALGYAAIAGLAAPHVARAAGPLVACGRRSLSCYLAQSVLMVPLLAPWGLGWGGSFGTASAAALAVAVWAATVLWAWALDAAGRRGPAETLLRRVVYRGQPSERQGSARSRAT